MGPKQYAPSTSSKLGALKKNQGEEGVQWGTGDVSERTKTNVSDGTSTLQGMCTCAKLF